MVLAVFGDGDGEVRFNFKDFWAAGLGNDDATHVGWKYW